MLASRFSIPIWLASLTLGAVTSASAADLTLLPPPVPIYSGWYLRGDIGFSNQKVDSLYNPAYSGYSWVTNVDKGFDAAPIFDLGIGYQVNNWLRFDVTGEYRGKANFHGLDIGVPLGGVTSIDDRYTASKSEWTFLFNSYIDLGTWYNVTPFLGAGIGTSRNTISNFGDVGIHYLSDTNFATGSKWSFAWAIYAGLGYQVSPNLTVELAYRYIDLGDAITGTGVSYDGAYTWAPFEFHHLTSNDIRIGLRFNLYSPHEYAPPPIPSKG